MILTVNNTTSDVSSTVCMWLMVYIIFKQPILDDIFVTSVTKGYYEKQISRENGEFSAHKPHSLSW